MTVTGYDETLAMTVLGPINLAIEEEVSDEHTIFDQPEGTYTNTATATGFDEGGHEVTDSDSATCRISTMVGGEIIEAVSKCTRRNIAIAAYALIGLVAYLLIRRLN